MRSISLSRKLDSDSYEVYKINKTKVAIINLSRLLKSECKSCSVSTICPLESRRFMPLKLKNITNDFLDNPPVCILIGRDDYKMSLYMKSLVKNLISNWDGIISYK